MNPWQKVRRVGKANVGKPQLRIDEARKLEAVAIRRAQNGDVPALGVLLMLYLGLRQGRLQRGWLGTLTMGKRALGSVWQDEEREAPTKNSLSKSVQLCSSG